MTAPTILNFLPISLFKAIFAIAPAATLLAVSLADCLPPARSPARSPPAPLAALSSAPLRSTPLASAPLASLASASGLASSSLASASLASSSQELELSGNLSGNLVGGLSFWFALKKIQPNFHASFQPNSRDFPLNLHQVSTLRRCQR